MKITTTIKFDIEECKIFHEASRLLKQVLDNLDEEEESVYVGGFKWDYAKMVDADSLLVDLANANIEIR